MPQYTIKILGAQFTANPDYKFGDPETEEICGRTIDMLTKLKNTKPRVEDNRDGWMSRSEVREIKSEVR